jgi:hypothetical protein
MAVANGYGKVVTSGSVFMYDIGDTYNSYIGEPTTNIFRHYGTTGQGSAADNAVNFEIQGTTGFIRLGYGQTFGGYTIQPNDVVYKYDLGGYGCHYHGNDVSIPSGRSVTFTFDFYVSPGAASYPITNFLANIETGTGTGMSVGAPNNLTGVWQTISVTTGPSTSSGNIRMLLYPGACGGALAGDGYVLYKNPQVELLPHKTPFTQTSRSVSGSLLPIVGDSTINLSTVSFDSNAQMIFDGTDDRIALADGTKWFSNDWTYEMILKFNSNTGTYQGLLWGEGDTGGGSGLQMLLTLYNYTYFHYRINNSITGWSDTNSPTINFTPTNYNHIIWQFNNGTTNIYVNGNLFHTNSSRGSYSGGTTSPLYIGSRNDAAYPFSGQIPVLKRYNRTLTISEIQQNYNKYKSRFNLS